jgi:ribonucleoside-diphosphate reductase alpha chain
MDTIFLDSFAEEVWKTTYKHHEDKTIDDTLRRVAYAVGSVEKTPELKTLWSQNFYELLTGFKLCAGGRILANAGTGWKGTTLMNCFVGPKPKHDQDSIEGIFHVVTQQVLTLKSEGGWGMNFSFIRPRGSFIGGIGVESPGSVKYMEVFNTTSDVITAGSGKQKKNAQGKIKIRKGAMMAVLDVWHPDIEEFITAKLQAGRLNKFNISVNCTNEFMDKVNHVTILKRIIEKDSYSIEEYSKNSQSYPSLDVFHTSRYQCQQTLEEIDKWELVFPDTKYPAYKAEWDGNIAEWKAKGYPVVVHKTIKVSQLWDLIMNSTYTRNDPGVLFLDRANETHCWNYGGQQAHIAATNPCGEQCLPFGAVCNLASINLTQFVTEDGKFNFTALEKYVAWGVRFLDNVNDLTGAPLPEYAQSIKERRRIGLGVMGWGSMLFMMKLRFGSDEAEFLKVAIMQTLTRQGVKASIELAAEKGMFVGCDPVKHANHKFFADIGIPKNLKEQMEKYGIRNSALFSCQPTGNTGILTNVVSGGIEPVFMPEYIRTVIVDGCPDDLRAFVPKYWEGEHVETETFKWVFEGDDKILKGVINGITYKIDRNRGLTKEVLCQDYGVRWLKTRNEWDAKADWAVTTLNLKVKDHVVDMQGFGKWIDSSISKTVNLPQDYPYEDFKTLYLDSYKSGFMKGITTYRDGTMMSVLASATKEDKEKTDTLVKTVAPKRPKSMEGELHHFTIDGKKYYVAVGLYGDGHEPYEVFTGVNETKKEIYIPKNVKRGKIEKFARKDYSFLYLDDDSKETIKYELTNGHSNETASALSRMISCSLRHGSDISFIVHQLEKTEGPIISFSKALARTLKKYIKNGTSVAGEECPECKGKLVREEGCCSCKSCGFSKCS